MKQLRSLFFDLIVKYIDHKKSGAAKELPEKYIDSGEMNTNIRNNNGRINLFFPVPSIFNPIKYRDIAVKPIASDDRIMEISLV